PAPRWTEAHWLPPPLGEGWGGGRHGQVAEDAECVTRRAPIPTFPQTGKEKASPSGKACAQTPKTSSRSDAAQRVSTSMKGTARGRGGGGGGQARPGGRRRGMRNAESTHPDLPPEGEGEGCPLWEGLRSDAPDDLAVGRGAALEHLDEGHRPLAQRHRVELGR